MYNFQVKKKVDFSLKFYDKLLRVFDLKMSQDYSTCQQFLFYASFSLRCICDFSKWNDLLLINVIRSLERLHKATVI